MHLNCLAVDVAAMRGERDSAPATEAFYCIDFGDHGVFAGIVWLFNTIPFGEYQRISHTGLILDTWSVTLFFSYFPD